jgi:hypothetical protein
MATKHKVLTEEERKIISDMLYRINNRIVEIKSGDYVPTAIQMLADQVNDLNHFLTTHGYENDGFVEGTDGLIGMDIVFVERIF